MAKVLFKYRPPPGLPGGAAADARDSQQPPERPAVDGNGVPTDRWWYESSYDLRSGLEVSDSTDTVPGDLLDELFKR